MHVGRWIVARIWVGTWSVTLIAVALGTN